MEAVSNQPFSAGADRSNLEVLIIRSFQLLPEDLLIFRIGQAPEVGGVTNLDLVVLDIDIDQMFLLSPSEELRHYILRKQSRRPKDRSCSIAAEKVREKGRDIQNRSRNPVIGSDSDQ